MSKSTQTENPDVELGMRFCVCHCNSPMFGCANAEGVPLLFGPGKVVRGSRVELPGRTQVFGVIFWREKWRSFIITVFGGQYEGKSLIC